jgi:signal transduction protein with GAF and PtsI domain
VGKLAWKICQPMTDEQITELADNLDSGLRCFVHKETKAIVTTPDSVNDPLSDSELWDDANEVIENNFDSYAEIDKMDSRESFRLMEKFIEIVEDERLRDKLDQALRRPKPFWNFKFEVDNSGPYRQKWFDFKKQQLIEWVKEQLTVNDL